MGGFCYTDRVQFTITIPEKISLNKIYAGVHWSKRKEWKDDYYYAVLAAKIAPYSGQFPIHARYHFKLTGKALDASNCAFMVKCVEDALVSAGIIPDDTPKYIASVRLSSEKGKVDEVEVEFIHSW